MRAAAIILTTFLLAGCGKVTPTLESSSTPAFTVVSEQASPSGDSLTVDIRIAGPVTEAEVKSIAEGVIAGRSQKHSLITVRSYLGDAASPVPPLAESRLAGGTVTHRFNTQGSKKIPTH
jgi:hypothetical protein